MLAAAGGLVGAVVVLDVARDLQRFAIGPIDPGALAGTTAGALAAALAALAVVIGLRTMAATRDASRAPLRIFEHGGPTLPLIAFSVALGAGQLALLGDGGDGLIVALAHPIAATMPAMAIVAAIAVRQGGADPGLVLRGLLWGAFVATAIAFVAEVFFLGIIGLLLYMGLSSSPDGRALIETIRSLVEQVVERPESFDPSLFEGADAAAIVLRPSVILAALALFGLFGPAVEELAKVAGVASIKPRDRARAFLAGAACGAGFGAAEAMLLGMAGLGPLWAASMLVRVFSSLMHAVLGGMAGIGWHAISGEGRWAAGVAGIGAAILGHGLWNALVLSAVIGGIGAEYAAEPAATAGSALALVSPLGLVLLVGVFLRRLKTLAGTVGSDRHTHAEDR